MKLEPVNSYIIGRIAITKTAGLIVSPDPTKNTSKFVFIESVSPEAEAAGFRPGDLVMPRSVGNIFLQAGSYLRVTLPISDVICFVRDASMDDFVDHSGQPFVVEQGQGVPGKPLKPSEDGKLALPSSS
jgi:hypothetical protein